MSNRKRLIFSIILILTLLTVGVSLFLTIKLTSKRGDSVNVYIKGEKVATYSLLTNAEYSLNGGTNVIVIKDGAVYMKHADCPKETCVSQRGCRFIGQTIVCLPNNVVVKVTGNGDGIFLS